MVWLFKAQSGDEYVAMRSSAMTRGARCIALRAGNYSQLPGHVRVGVLPAAVKEKPAAVSAEQEDAGYFYHESSSGTQPDWSAQEDGQARAMWSADGKVIAAYPFVQSAQVAHMRAHALVWRAFIRTKVARL